MTIDGVMGPVSIIRVQSVHLLGRVQNRPGHLYRLPPDNVDARHALGDVPV